MTALLLRLYGPGSGVLPCCCGSGAGSVWIWWNSSAVIRCGSGAAVVMLRAVGGPLVAVGTPGVYGRGQAGGVIPSNNRKK